MPIGDLQFYEPGAAKNQTHPLKSICSNVVHNLILPYTTLNFRNLQLNGF